MNRETIVARELKVGDRLRRKKGLPVTITAIDWRDDRLMAVHWDEDGDDRFGVLQDDRKVTVVAGKAAPTPAGTLHRWSWMDAVLGDPRLGALEVAVAAALASHWNHKTGMTIVGRERLGLEVNRTPDTVGKALRLLRDHGYIETRRRFNSSNATRFHLPADRERVPSE